MDAQGRWMQPLDIIVFLYFLNGFLDWAWSASGTARSSSSTASSPFEFEWWVARAVQPISHFSSPLQTPPAHCSGTALFKVYNTTSLRYYPRVKYALAPCVASSPLACRQSALPRAHSKTPTLCPAAVWCRYICRRKSIRTHETISGKDEPVDNRTHFQRPARTTQQWPQCRVLLQPKTATRTCQSSG